MKDNEVTSLSASLRNRNEITLQFGANDDDVTSTTTSVETDDLNKPSNIHMFSASSTLHGFSHIFALHHSSLRRFAWTVAFLTSLTLFLLQSSNRVIYYRGYPHVTKIDEVTAGDLNFPAVTICNLNELRFGEMTKNDMFHVGKFLGFLDDNDTLIRPEYFDDIDSLEPSLQPKMRRIQERIERLSNFDGFKGSKDFNMSEFYNRAGHNIKDYLLGCKYRGGICNHTSFIEDRNGSDPKPSDFVFFASNSTFHGISHIITSGRFTLRKALWAVAFFSSLGLFLVQAYDRYSYYRSHPHVTKLDEEEALEMNFPAITICNMNPFRLSAITSDDFFYAGKILGLLNDDYSMQVTFKDNRTWPDVSKKLAPILQQRSDYKPRNKLFNMFEFYNRTGHEMKATVKRCRYRGTPCEGSKYWIPVYTRYGKCYTFNSGTNSPPLKTLKGGVDNGLEILLDTQQDQYMPVWKETDEISVEAGFKVQIHSQTEPPFIHELGFGVAPGFQTLIATQEQRITFLPDPWGNCVEGFDKSQHSHFKNYSISACRITCETKFIFDNCKCRMIHMPGDDIPYCTPEQYMSCADSALDFLVKEDVKQCVCETPCDVTRYNLEMSMLQLPSTQALSYLAYKFQETEDYVKNNYVKLNIFFEALNYETIEQKVAYEIPGLFGDIGGQMGLFIGASILTILELFDYVYEVIKEKTCGGKRKQKKNDIERGTLTEVDKPNATGSGKDYILANHQCVQPHSIEGNHPTRYTSSYGTYSTRHDDYMPTRNTNVYPLHNHRNQDDDFRSLPPPPVQYTGRATTPQPSDRPITFNRSRGFVPRTNVAISRRDSNRRPHALSASYTDLNHYEDQQDQDSAHDQYSYKPPQYLEAFSTIDTGTTSFSGQVNPQSSSSIRSRPGSRIIAPTPIILSDSPNPSYSAPMMMTSPQHNGMSGKEFITASIETDIH